MRNQVIRASLLLGLAVGLATAVAADHATVTITSVTNTPDAIAGDVVIDNNTAAALTGAVTLNVFIVQRNGKLVHRFQTTLAPNLVVNAADSEIVSFNLDTSRGVLRGRLRRGRFLIVADFGAPPPAGSAHSHCSAVIVDRPPP